MPRTAFHAEVLDVERQLPIGPSTENPVRVLRRWSFSDYAADRGAVMPANASDPLEYLGALGPLDLEPDEIAGARHLTRDVIDEHSTEHAWRYRVRYKAELEWILRF